MRVIITCCDSLFYKSCVTLIASLHRTSYDSFDYIIVYDLGLTKEEIKYLKNLDKVDKVISLSEICQGPEFFEGFLEPKHYAFKARCWVDAAKYSDHILWLDSGVMAISDVSALFQIIEEQDILVVNYWRKTNLQHTHPTCQTIMKATPQELKGHQLSANVMGYKVNGKFQKMIDETYHFCKIKACITGPKNHQYNSKTIGHRHDQSILSILSLRHAAPRQKLEIYACYPNCKYYNPEKEDYEYIRNIERALELGAIIWVHRNKYLDESGLRHFI